jgi:hypothetical protein
MAMGHHVTPAPGVMKHEQQHQEKNKHQHAQHKQSSLAERLTWCIQ